MKKNYFKLFVAMLFATNLMAQNIPSYLPTNGLVGWWPFNGNANDESGNGNHGTVNGATLTTDRNGVTNSAYYFNGSQKVDFGILQKFKSTSSFTVSIWFKTIYPNQGCLFSRGDYAQMNQIKGQIVSLNNNDVVEFGMRSNGKEQNARGISNVTDNKWHQAIWNHEGNGKINIYIDGKLESSGVVNNLIDLQYNLVLANLGGSGYYYKGSLDDFAVWSRALTQQEITALYLGDCSKPLAAITPKSNTNIKENESVVLAATQGNEYTYTWYKDGTAIANATDSNYTATLPGVYTVKVTTAACDSTSAGVTVKRTLALPNYLPTNGLVGYWPFNGNANDESGNGNHGTVNGATLTSDRNGIENKAYDFNGINQFISINNSISIQYIKTISVSIWLRTRNYYNWGGNSYFPIMCKTNNSSYFGYYNVEFNPSGPNSFINMRGSYDAKYIKRLETWYHLVVVNDQSNVKYYINGKLIGTYNCVNQAGGIGLASDLPLEIGRDVAGAPKYTNGQLDDIAIYNRALTEQEITALYLSETCTKPQAAITPKSNTNIKENESVVLAATQGNGYTYTWYKDGTAIPNAIDSNFTATLPGVYTVKVTSAACDSTSAGVTVKRALTLPNYLPTNGLVGWWPFNGNANDESGNGNNGIVNGATLTSDKNGKANGAYSFDGMSNYIDLGILSSLNCTNPFTISIWFNQNASPGQDMLFCRGDYAQMNQFKGELALGGKINFGMRTNGNQQDVRGNLILDNGKWHQSIFINDGAGNIVVYVDGKLEASGKISNLINLTENLVIGRLGKYTNYFYKGLIDDIAIYNRALTPQEIKGLYSGGNINSAKVGEFKYGGKIAYILGPNDPKYDPTKTQGIVSYDKDMEISEWGCYGNTLNGPSKDKDQPFFLEIGGGSLNTDSIVSQCKNNSAAYRCSNLNVNGYNDWYLPSINELKLLYNNKDTIGGFKAENYWSSTQDDIPNGNSSIFAWRLDFKDGTTHTTGSYKNTKYNVRPVRFFSENIGETCTKPQAAITPKSTTNIKEKESVILAATQGNGYSYAWYKDGVAIANATDSNYTAILPGVYTVKVTSASCDSTSTGVTVKRVYALPNYLPTNGLVGWWPFNGNANDESGNGNHGTVNGATLATDRNGKRNNSFSFDGISNYISIYDKENLRLLNTDFTLNTWILLDDLKSNINHIFYKGQSSGDVSKFLFAINNNKIGFHTNPPASLNYWKMSNPILQSQNWLMVTVLKNNDKLVFYINGMKDVESLLNYSIPNTDGIPIRIGGAEPNGSGWMKGKLDDISIYNRALTQEEITDLYLGEACTTPIATITPKSTTNIKENESVVLAATQGNGYTYAWYKDGVAITNATDSNYTATLPGVYNVKVTSAACDSTSAGVTVKRAYTLPNYLPTNGLVGWWPFNGNANDESGNENHGTVNGATLTSDRNGVANSTYNFKGINDYIEMKQSNSPIQIMNGITVSFWFKTNNSNTNDNRKFIISKYKNGHGIQIELTPNGTNLTNGSLRMGLRDASSIEPESNVYSKDRYDNNLWHFGVLTFNNTKLTQYIDNIKKGEFYTNNKNFDNDQVLIFGALKNDYYLWQNGTAFFDGCIDDIAIYNRALTQEEITALYLGEACTTPIASITPQSATSFCSGGSVNINAATNANYTYQWLNNGAAISAASTATYKATTSGKYSVIVKNNSGCIDTSSVVTVTVTPTPSLPILTGPSTLCYNSKAIFKASIAGGTWGVANDYLLISSPQGLFRNNKMPPSNLYKTGVTYTLKSKDQLCSVTAQKSVWIRNVAATSITLTAPKQTLKVGEEVAATATTKITGNALFWMSASTSFVSVTGVSPYIALVKGLRPASGANITFSADDATKGCRNTAFLPFNVTAAASMVENETNTSIYTTDLNVYPNPSNGIVTIENIGDAKTISLIDVTGRVLKTTPVNADRMRLDYSTITKGNYFISIQGENLKEMKSIVIE